MFVQSHCSEHSAVVKYLPYHMEIRVWWTFRCQSLCTHPVWVDNWRMTLATCQNMELTLKQAIHKQLVTQQSALLRCYCWNAVMKQVIAQILILKTALYGRRKQQFPKYYHKKTVNLRDQPQHVYDTIWYDVRLKLTENCQVKSSTRSWIKMETRES